MKTQHPFALLSILTLTTLGALALTAKPAAAQEEGEEAQPVMVEEKTVLLVDEEEVYLVEEDEVYLVEEAPVHLARPRVAAPRLGFEGRIVSNGLRIDRVNYDSLAFDLGLERGDVILKVNGRRVTSMEGYRRLLVDAVENRDGEVTLQIENIRWHTGESSQRYVNRTVYLPVSNNSGSSFGG